ncbi:type VII secretion target [Nocardioides dubius]|uniref:WXG100 family type VII secretion target n=1 Tax=Nocardioides dubius TaxID=317019 RepID=A0ABN1TU25_9ACTN
MPEVVPEAINKAADKVEDAADGIKTNDPSTALAGIGTAMPSSSSASAAEALTTQWETRFATLNTDMTTHGTNLHGAADGWVEADGSVAGGYPVFP